MKCLVLLAAVFAVACRPADRDSQGGVPYAAAAAAVSAAAPAGDARLARADHARIQGDSAAPVWLIEISDFQCPYCKLWHDSTYPVIRREYIDPGHVRMAYVNFPIRSHRNAQPAAEAAMCAAAQDRFWTMHDALFATQSRWDTMPSPGALFDSLARRTGVAMPEWRECVRSGAMQSLIAGDRMRGSSAGVNVTPFFFVGDEAISGAAPASAFRDAIARARTKAAQNPRR